MKKLYSAPQAFQLEPLRGLLKQAGIECFLQNEFPPAAGEVPPIVAWPTLWVIDEQRFEEAKAILDDFLASEQL